MKMPDAPIFVAGLARSGKTQLRLVLEAHPEISMTRRTDMWNRFYARFGNLHDPENLERCLAALAADARVAQLTPDTDRIRREFYAGPLEYARLFGIVHRHHAERLGRRRWGEQLKLIERYAPVIFPAFSDARMIHMVRDPRTRRNAGCSGRRRKGSLGWETAMWLESVELARRNQSAYAHAYRVVTYEELAERTDDTLQALCAWLGEDYTPEMRRATRSLRFDRAGRVPDLPLESSFVEKHAGRSLEAFGYVPTERRLSVSERLRYIVTEWPVNRATMAARQTTDGRRAVHEVGSP
jgi:hypothetical protein